MAAAAKEVDGGSGDRIGHPTTDEKKRDRSPVAAMLGSGHGNGWRVLKDGEDVPSARDDKDGNAVPIEPRETGSGSSAMPGDGDEDVGEGNGGDVVVYKVYKRRWFGLVQLVLLNIIVSWDWLTFAPVSSSAALYFNTSETTVNWLSTLFLFSFVVATPAVIYVLHLGPKPSIITAATLVLAGNWIRYAGSHSKDSGTFGVVLFGQILTGLAQPFVLSAPARYSDLWFSPRGRVAATAVVSLANPFGAALGQLIVPEWVSSPSDVSDMVLYVAIIATVCSVPSFFIPSRPPTPAAPSGETPKLSLKESIHILTSHLEFWLIFLPFAVYVGFFNSISSLLNQILEPYAFSETDAGIAGALLIVVGLVAAAITSPIIDRTKAFIPAMKSTVPVIGFSFLIFVWMPETRNVVGPYVVLAILGAASFSLIPVVIELLVELTHPISPEVTSTLAWSGGQLLGGCFIVISDALKEGEGGDPPFNMKRALVFTAVVAMVVMPLPLFLGLFGRRDKVLLKRVRSDVGGGSISSA